MGEDGAGVIARTLRFRPAKPVLAAVNGLAYGGGLELVLSCDLAVCSEQALFALPAVKRGVLATGGGLVRLPRVIGPRPALQMTLTGEPVDEAAFQRIKDSADALEGPRAFAEKRPPTWQGRLADQVVPQVADVDPEVAAAG
jgi:Enoyl-CoA hydratase/isomerase